MSHQFSRRSAHARTPRVKMALAALALAALTAAPAWADGSVVAAWGDNQGFKLGDGTNTRRTTPVRIGAAAFLDESALQVTAGVFHACAVTVTAQAYCWGTNSNGQLGVGDTTARTSPTQASGSYISIAAGSYHTCAVRPNGVVYCWGYNAYSQIGDGTITQRNTPLSLSTSGALAGKTLVAVAAGDSHSCALATTGAVYCWGANSSGQLGDGTTTPRTTPVAVDAGGALAGRKVTQISAGRSHTCAVTSDGAAFCWGLNAHGQLGDGTTTNRATPVAVATGGALAGKTITQIASQAGSDHTCAVASDGAAFCWGLNTDGQLGDGATTQRTSPVAISTAGALAGKIVTRIATGRLNTCALSSQGQAYCWGFNSNGQLGNGTTTQSSTPVAVDVGGALAGQYVSAIALGQNFAVAAAPGCGPGAPVTAGSGALWAAMTLPCNNHAMTNTQVAYTFGAYGGGGGNGLTPGQYNTSNPAGGTGWVVYRHNAANNTLVMLSLTDTLERGTGYWFRSYEAPKHRNKLVMPGLNPVSTPITAPVTQAQGCASANGCFAIRVATNSRVNRFNMLGNPFPWAVDWSQVRVRVDGSAATYTPSQAAGLAASGNASPPVLSHTFWTWNGTAYDAYSDLAPTIGNLPYFGAFWVEALPKPAWQMLELLVPKDPATRP